MASFDHVVDASDISRYGTVQTVTVTQQAMSEKTNSTKRKATPKPNQGERLNVDTSGLSEKERAALAESLVRPAKKRRPASNNVNPDQQKVGQIAGKHPENVKSGEDPRSNENWKVHNLKGLSQEARDRVIAGALAEAAEARIAKGNKPARKAKPTAAPKPEQKPEEKRPPGRPSDYSQELADRICAELAEGKSMRTVCLAEDMPAMSTVFKWLRERKEFSEQYAKAKTESADAMVEEMIDIADDGRNDWMEAHDRDGDFIGYKVNGDHIQRSRLRVETRKWIAAKLKPKKYGEKVDLNHGVQPENPLATLLAQVAGTHMTPKSGKDDD